MELMLLGMERTVVNVLLGDFTSKVNIHTEDEYNHYFKLIMAFTDPNDLKKSIENLVIFPYIFSKGTEQKYFREASDEEKIRIPEPKRTLERMMEIMAHNVITLFSGSDPEGFLRKAINEIKHIDESKEDYTTLLCYAVFVCTIMRRNVELSVYISDESRPDENTALYLIDRNGLL